MTSAPSDSSSSASSLSSSSRPSSSPSGTRAGDWRDSIPAQGGAHPGSDHMALKILVAGGFGVGKTTLVGAVSEIRPLRTEEMLTDASAGVDDLRGVEGKTTTTVAMDFGRLAFNDGITLYLFGTPGQERFWFMWDDMAYGSIGAIVLADTRRLTASFASIDFFEQRDTPFIVAVNCFDGARSHTLKEIRTALDVDPHIPIVLCDVRDRESARSVLISLVEHALDLS